MFFRDHHNIVLSIHDVIVNMHQPHQVDVAGIVDSHVLFEEPAEVFSAQSDLGRDRLQRDGFPVMFSYIIGNLIEPFPDSGVLYVFLKICEMMKEMPRMYIQRILYPTGCRMYIRGISFIISQIFR